MKINAVSFFKQKSLYLLRGTIYIFLYKLRFFPVIQLARLKNKYPLIKITADKTTFQLLLDLSDPGLSQDLFISKIREYPNAQYFSDFLKKYHRNINTFFDIGSNIGYYLVFANSIFKKLKRKDIKMFSFEPIEENYDLLRKNVKLNKIDNVSLNKIAIGDKSGKTKMLVPHRRNLSHVVSSSKSLIKNSSLQIITMSTIENYFSKNKIPRKNILFRWDIEGYEYNLLKGSLGLFKKLKKSYIIMEFHPHLLGKQKTIETLKILEASGFSLEYLISCYPRYYLPFPPWLRNIFKKLWILEKKGGNLGILKEIKTINQLIYKYQGIEKEQSSLSHHLYSYHHFHLYLFKK